MHRTWLLILSLLVVFPTAGLARIGEHLPDCVYRYGKPVYHNAETNVYLFQKEGFVIGVIIYEERVNLILYEKAEKDILNNSAPLSDNEIELLMQINGGKRKWKRRVTISIEKEWETDDGELVGMHDPLSHKFTVTTKEHIQRFNAEKKEKEKQSIQKL
jgi:hypothetical protein